MKAIVHLELNELNFNYIKEYVASGKLPGFKKILEGGFYTTRADEEYKNLEPWIQWPTVYRGQSFDKHGIFRLGDAVYNQAPQLWDKMEQKGLAVEALFPMNAVNSLAKSNLFLPDPWTNTTVLAPTHLRWLYDFVRASVLNNSKGSISVWAAIKALPGIVSIGDIKFWKSTLTLFRASLKYPRVYRPIVLDLIVFQLLKSRVNGRHKLHYISAFMNAGAHLQHHYYFDSAVNTTNFTNPKWYSPVPNKEIDPLFELYSFYDSVVDQLISMDIELFITTGLSQKPNQTVYHQYRAVDFDSIAKLCKAGMENILVKYRMSRDFEITSTKEEYISLIKNELVEFKIDGESVFTVDDREHSLFCKVSYNGEPEGLSNVAYRGDFYDLTDSFVHVSIENQIHTDIGYFADPEGILDEKIKSNSFALEDLHNLLLNHVYEKNSVQNV